MNVRRPKILGLLVTMQMGKLDFNELLYQSTSTYCVAIIKLSSCHETGYMTFKVVLHNMWNNVFISNSMRIKLAFLGLQ